MTSAKIMLVAVAAIAFAQTRGESVTTWADDAIAVDAGQSSFRIVTGTAALWCSPDWCTGGTNVSGSTYSLKVVSDPDTANAATASVSALDYSSACEVSYSGSGYVRFLLSAEAGGTPVGATLVRDVSFGVMSGLSSAVAYDNRASSLQKAVRRGGAINLEYDTFWKEGAASLSIGAVALSGRGGEATATNALFNVSEEAAGTTAMRGLDRGDWRLLCQLKSGSGETLLEYLTDEFRVSGGFFISVR